MYVNVDVTTLLLRENMLMTLQCFQSLSTRNPRAVIVSDLFVVIVKASESVMNGEIKFRMARESEREKVLEFLREHFFKVSRGEILNEWKYLETFFWLLAVYGTRLKWKRGAGSQNLQNLASFF